MANTYDSDARRIAFVENYCRPMWDAYYSFQLACQAFTAAWQNETDETGTTMQTAFGDSSATFFIQDSSAPDAAAPDGRPPVNHLNVAQLAGNVATATSNVGGATILNENAAMSINGRNPLPTGP